MGSIAEGLFNLCIKEKVYGLIFGQRKMWFDLRVKDEVYDKCIKDLILKSNSKDKKKNEENILIYSAIDIANRGKEKKRRKIKVMISLR